MSNKSQLNWLEDPKRLFALWFAACAFVLAFHIPTLSFAPLVYQDEVQILDYGRTAFNPDSGWSISWLVDENAPKLSTSWPSVALQELAYKVSAPSNFGPRLMTVLSGILASTLMLGWLLARKTPPAVAALLALVLLIDPVFSDNYQGGRVDGWAFSACLGACWFLRLALARIKKGEPLRGSVFAAGLLAGMSPFLWLNAAILLPLVLLELFHVLVAAWKNQSNARARILPVLTVFALGGLLSVTMMLIPLISEWEHYWTSFLANFEVQTQAAVIRKSFIHLFATHDPLIALAALVALVIYRDWGLMVAFLVALLIIYQTMVYLPRVMYLLPYLLGLIAAAAAFAHENRSRAKIRRLLINRTLALLLIWNIAVTLIIRPTSAVMQTSSNDPDQINFELERAIGSGPKRVLVEEWSAYYAARALGWHQFRPAAASAPSNYLDLLNSMDFLVLKNPPMTQDTVVLADDAGFELQETIRFERHEPIEWSLGPIELRLPVDSYPSLSVYRKANSATMTN